MNITIIAVGTAALALIIYLTIFFILSRIFIPNLNFRKSKLPRNIPKPIIKKIQFLKKRSKNREAYLKNVYKFLTRKYQGKRRTILTKPKLLFETNLEKIWKIKGFIPCHTFSNLIRIFLVKSKKFKDKDIRIKHTFFQFSIHQYLEVKIKRKWKKVDGWAKGIGIKFGDHARMFK